MILSLLNALYEYMKMHAAYMSAKAVLIINILRLSAVILCTLEADFYWLKIALDITLCYERFRTGR